MGAPSASLAINAQSPGQDRTSLVNDHQIRRSVRRLFTGKMEEILGELFQNSQRAGASRVWMTTSSEQFTYSDDGHGIPGEDGFLTLLRLGESGFENPHVQEWQDPMGLGIHSLLAHQDVQQVTFESHGLRLTIDTGWWWDDRHYYTTWHDRLERVASDVQADAGGGASNVGVDGEGLRIEVIATEAFVAKLRSSLDSSSSAYDSLTGPTAGPAQGYKDILQMFLNDQPVDTSLPRWAEPSPALVELEWEECPLLIGYGWPLGTYGRHQGHRPSVVDWYGQIITVPSSSPFNFYLKVRKGRPLNPMSPSRRGIIQDAAFRKLLKTFETAVFTFLKDPANRANIQPAWVEAAHTLNRARALALPYFLATPYVPLAYGEAETVDDLDVQALSERRVVDYSAAQPPASGTPTEFFLDGTVTAWLLPRTGVAVVTSAQSETDGEAVNVSEEWTDFFYGLSSFLPHLEVPVYNASFFDPSRLPVGTLYWRPGIALELSGSSEHSFYGGGEWGVTYDSSEPEQWFPLTGSTPVFAFDTSSGYDVSEIELYVGLPVEPSEGVPSADVSSGERALPGGAPGDVQQAVRFYNGYGWCMHNPESDYADWDDFDRSLAACIRTVLGRAVSSRFAPHELMDHLPTGSSRLNTVEYIYEGDARNAIAILVTNELGEQVQLSLVD